MKAFLILDLTITDMANFKTYISRIPEFIAKHGGQYLIKGSVPVTIEGDWQPDRIVVLEFPNKTQAQAFLNDPEAQPLFNIRKENTVSKLILAEES